jgi:hypothetical protein
MRCANGVSMQNQPRAGPSGVMNTSRSHLLAALGAALVVAISASASPAAGRPAGRLASACLHNAARAAACGLILDYFGALNAGRGRKACSLLGERLQLESGGPSCPTVLAMSRGTPFAIVDARTTPSGVQVLLTVGLHELDHWRMLDWIALIGPEAGHLRILDTQRST